MAELAFKLLIIALATFQVCRWITVEVGPFHIFEHLRGKVIWKWFDNCAFCIGVWVAVCLLFLVAAFPNAVWFLACIGVFTLITQISQRLDHY